MRNTWPGWKNRATEFDKQFRKLDRTWNFLIDFFKSKVIIVLYSGNKSSGAKISTFKKITEHNKNVPNLIIIAFILSSS